MKKIVLSFVMIFSALFANVDENIIKGSAYGNQVVDETPVVGYDPRSKDESYSREVIYNFVLLNKKQRIAGANAEKMALVNFVEVNNTTPAPITTDDNNTISVMGFCLIKNDIHVGKQPSSLMVDCETNIGLITMFANLKTLNEFSTLAVDPVHIDYKRGRYKVKSSVVTNEAKTSYNIATYVNDRKLSEIGYSSLTLATDEIHASSSQYLKAVEDSKKKEDITYADVGSGASATTQPIKITNVERPQAADYIIGAGINIVAGTIKTTAEIFKKDLPYLYEIAGGSKIYIDMQVEKKGEKIQ